MTDKTGADKADEQEPPSLDAFSDRLEAVRKRTTNDKDDAAASERGKSVGRGFRLASELLAAMIVGIGLGMGVDMVAKTSPWGLLAGIFIGFAAGLRNAMAAFDAAAADNADDETGANGADR